MRFTDNRFSPAEVASFQRFAAEMARRRLWEPPERDQGPCDEAGPFDRFVVGAAGHPEQEIYRIEKRNGVITLSCAGTAILTSIGIEEVIAWWRTPQEAAA